MIDDKTKEGRHYIVYSRQEGNKVTAHFDNWDDVEKFVVADENSYKIFSIDLYDMPLTGIRERAKIGDNK